MAAFTTLARSLAPLALIVAVGTAHAAAPGYYAATPAAAPGKPNLMTRDTPWRLQGTTYVADRAPERADILCQLVANRVGQLSAFSAGGSSFDTDALAKCNAKAKPAPATTVAAR